MTSEPLPPVAPPLVEHDALPPGTRFGELEIVRVLGVGGFGIVYLARDHALERHVALKEYMPATLARRGVGPMITVRSGSHAQTYAIGLRSFVNEARLLARFDHPSLVKVYRFWEDNATAYMVMPYLQGRTLRDVRRSISQSPSEMWIRHLLGSLLSAIELLHREGVFHRDIAPDNILLPPEGPPILLDFGAARRVISDRTQTLTAILKPNYAPIEQYAEMAQLRQGPWTDLYALGAVAHFLLFGVPPPPATARAVHDELANLPHRLVEGISPRLLGTVAWMLAVRPQHRPQNVDALRDVLEGRAPVPAVPLEPEQPPSDMTLPLPGRTDFPPTRRVEPSEHRLSAPGADDTVIRHVATRAAPASSAATETVAPQGGRRLRWAALAGGFGALAVAAAAWVGSGGSMRGPAATSTDVAQGGSESSAAAITVPQAQAQPMPMPAAPVEAAPFDPPVSPEGASVDAAGAAPMATFASPGAVTGSPREAIAPVPVIRTVPREAARPAARTAAAPRPAAAVRSSATMVPVRAIEPAPAAELPAAPTPVLSDAPAAESAGPATARQACGSRVFIALWSCMDRECERPRYRDQPECVKVLETKARRGQ